MKLQHSRGTRRAGCGYILRIGRYIVGTYNVQRAIQPYSASCVRYITFVASTKQRYSTFLYIIIINRMRDTTTERESNADASQTFAIVASRRSVVPLLPLPTATDTVSHRIVTSCCCRPSECRTVYKTYVYSLLCMQMYLYLLYMQYVLGSSPNMMLRLKDYHNVCDR